MRTASLAERNAGLQTPIPVYDRPTGWRKAAIIGHATTAAGARRVLRRHGVTGYEFVTECNGRPPCYMPIFPRKEG